MSQKLRIFIVENHPDTLAALETYLGTLGHSISTARTMTEALEKLRTFDPQVLISDIGLPDGDGWDLLRNSHVLPRVCAIAMTGFDTNADGNRSSAAGFRHHLTKPFDLDELDRILNEVALVID